MHDKHGQDCDSGKKHLDGHDGGMAWLDSKQAGWKGLMKLVPGLYWRVLRESAGKDGGTEIVWQTYTQACNFPLGGAGTDAA